MEAWTDQKASLRDANSLASFPLVISARVDTRLIRTDFVRRLDTRVHSFWDSPVVRALEFSKAAADAKLTTLTQTAPSCAVNEIGDG